MATVTLWKGRERSLLNHHPWVFSGAVDRVDGHPAPGDTVAVRASDGKFLGWGAYSPASQIRVRMWTFDEAERVTEAIVGGRIGAAVARRAQILSPGQTDALRLVHAESDGLPGLIVDRYAGTIVVQFLTVGAEHWRDLIIWVLQEEPDVTRIYERSDVEVRKLEGLPEQAGLISGLPLTGAIPVRENELSFHVDVQHGHKTGFYLDQRDNRRRLREFTPGKKVLNCFSYTGGFAVYALSGGADQVVSIDTSTDALSMGREHILMNGLDPRRAEWLQEDVFQALRTFRDQGKIFDVIVLDPPKFASTASQAARAARGYKDINLLAFKLLSPGGTLFTYSCSGGITAELFQKIVAGAALDAGVDAQIIGEMRQGSDHPVALNFPEGAYLKGLICTVMDSSNHGMQPTP